MSFPVPEDTFTATIRRSRQTTDPNSDSNVAILRPGRVFVDLTADSEADEKIFEGIDSSIRQHVINFYDDHPHFTPVEVIRVFSGETDPFGYMYASLNPFSLSAETITKFYPPWIHGKKRTQSECQWQTSTEHWAGRLNLKVLTKTENAWFVYLLSKKVNHVVECLVVWRCFILVALIHG
jgi:hypothetical protein